MPPPNILFPTHFQMSNGRINLNLETPIKNIISLNNIDFIPYYLDNTVKGNKGSNSVVLKLIQAQEFDEDEGYPEIPDLIIKVCKFSISKFGEHRNSKRFKLEIEALIRVY